jgi:hypothetical protein
MAAPIMTVAEARAVLAATSESIAEKLTNGECVLLARVIESANSRWGRAEKRVLDLEAEALDRHNVGERRNGAFVELTQERDAALTESERLEAKFSELAIADIVFEDWHNSLEKPARAKLSLHMLRALVTMLVRDECDPVSRAPREAGSVAKQLRFLSEIQPGLTAPRCGAKFTGLHASVTRLDTKTGKWSPCEPMAWIPDESKEVGP